MAELGEFRANCYTTSEYIVRVPIYDLADLTNTAMRVETPAGIGAVALVDMPAYWSLGRWYMHVQTAGGEKHVLGMAEGFDGAGVWASQFLQSEWSGFLNDYAELNGVTNLYCLPGDIDPNRRWGNSIVILGSHLAMPSLNCHYSESPDKWLAAWSFLEACPLPVTYIEYEGPDDDQSPAGTYTFRRCAPTEEEHTDFSNAECVISKINPSDWD